MTAATVWVVGATGMVGKAVTAALATRDVKVSGTGSEVDITDASAVRAYAGSLRPTHIINCAAMTAVDACEGDEARCTAVNGAGPGNLAAAAGQVGAASLHISTDYVFAGNDAAPQSESAPTGPKTAYGRSKLAGERAYLAAVNPSLPHFIVRTSWVFGPGGGNFVATMVRLMGERDSVQVVADQHGRPTYTPDLTRALLQLLGLHTLSGAAPQSSGIYHFANTGATTWHGLCCSAQMAAQAAGMALRCAQVLPVTSAAYPRPAPRPAHSVLATDKIERALGWAAPPFAEAVQAYVGQLARKV